MSIHNGLVYLSYHDWRRHLLHYRGRVDADGNVKAYHRNGDGSTAIMTGTVSGNQFNGDMQRGRCPYAAALTKG